MTQTIATESIQPITTTGYERNPVMLTAGHPVGQAFRRLMSASKLTLDAVTRRAVLVVGVGNDIRLKNRIRENSNGWLTPIGDGELYYIAAAFGIRVPEGGNVRLALIDCANDPTFLAALPEAMQKHAIPKPNEFPQFVRTSLDIPKRGYAFSADTMKQFSTAVKALCKASGICITKLARMLPVPDGMQTDFWAQALQTASPRITPDEAVLVATALGITIPKGRGAFTVLREAAKNPAPISLTPPTDTSQPERISEELKSAIGKLADCQKISIRDVANKLAVHAKPKESANSWRSRLSGQTKTTPTQLRQIAEVLGVEVGEWDDPAETLLDAAQNPEQALETTTQSGWVGATAQRAGSARQR